jgi:cell division protein FtsL
MNAAAKIIRQSDLFHGQLFRMHVSKSLWIQLILLVGVLISALCVVYTTNMTRITLSQLELAEHHAHRLALQRGQLLLEQASLATPSRVQQLASEKLHMILPTNKDTIVLRATSDE